MPLIAAAIDKAASSAASPAPSSLTPSMRQTVWLSSASKMPMVLHTLASARS